MNNNTKNKLVIAFEVPGLNCQKGCLLTIRRADTFRKAGHNLTSFKRYCPPWSCNGLLIMWQVIDTKNELRLWNPSIRKFLRIPPCPFPSDLLYKFVFGFAPSSKEHKILAITFDEEPGTQPKDMFFAVYTLSGQQWTVRNNGLNVERSCFERIFWSFYHPEDTVFLQGELHSIVRDLYGDNKYHLVSLDFNLEKLNFLELPHTFEKSYYNLGFLFILGESVVIFNISEVNASIWVLEIDGEKRMWTPWFSEPSTRDGYVLFKDHMYSKPLYYESEYGGCLIIGKKSYNIARGQGRSVENL